jgi:Fe-S-cluster containining protein
MTVHLDVVVDCADRFRACGAHCCTLDVPLTDEEFVSGRYQVSPSVESEPAASRRYLKRGDDGHCVYWTGRAEACGIYEHRPFRCRDFTCFGDTRFWRDFDGMVPNTKAVKSLLGRGTDPPAEWRVLLDEKALSEE